MRKDPPLRIEAAGHGEVPPTAGLLPRWSDLLARARGVTLEGALCTKLDVGDIEIVSTGTAALLIAFAYLRERMPERDVVIVPAYTCPLVVIAAAAADLRCVACDTAAGGFDLDLAHLRRLCGRSSGSHPGAYAADRVLAIVPTHYGGVLTDVEAVRGAAPGIAVVEDAAQAVGATWDGCTAGTFGDIGVLSLGAGKGLTIYEGGALLAQSEATMDGLRRVAARLTRSAALGELGRALMLLGYHVAYTPLGLRLVYGQPKRSALARGDEIGAAGDRFPRDVPVTRVGAWRKRVGTAALARHDAHLAECRARFDRLATRLRAIPGLLVHSPPPHARPSATSLLVTLPEHPERGRVIAALWHARLGVSRMFSRAIGDYPDLATLLLPSDTPHARELAAGTIAISTSGLMSPAAEEAIVAALEAFAQLAGSHRRTISRSA